MLNRETERRGTVGRASVTTPAGSVELAAVRESVSVAPNRPMPPVTVMSEADVRTGLAARFVSIGTDSAAIRHEGPLAQGQPHPRQGG